MRAIDKAVAAYESVQMRSIKIPEWEDLEVFFGPITVGDMKWAETRNPKTEYDSNLLLLIRKARDAEGAPLFQAGDKPMLENKVEMGILARLIEFMGKGVPSTSEAKEELEADPTSEPSSV